MPSTRWEIAQKMREARSRHLLRSSEVAAKQLRVFKAATPITPRKSESSATSHPDRELGRCLKELRYNKSMNEEKEICYPYAYGRLNSGLDMLANMLQWECMRKGIEIDDEVVDILQEMVQNLQKKAVVESYEHA